VLALVITALGAGASGSAAATQFGLSDQNSGFFGQPLFNGLNMATARLVVPWDVGIRGDPLVDRWLSAAAASGIQPFIAFEHARGDNCPDNPCVLPTPAEYGAAFAAFRRRYPQVRLFTPWNEANYVAQPTARDPAAAATFYDVVRAACPDCTVAAGDMLDIAGMDSWLASYRAALISTPAVWGLHDYVDANNFQTSGVDDLLRTVTGEIWLTETGGIVKLTAPGNEGWTFDPARAANAIRYVLSTVATRPRISRAYFYEWQADRTATFDSGLLAPGGTPRPGYEVLRGALGAGAVDDSGAATAPPAGRPAREATKMGPATVAISNVSAHVVAHGFVAIGFRCPAAAACVGRIGIESRDWRADSLARRSRGSPPLLPPESAPYHVRSGARGAQRLTLPRVIQRQARRGRLFIRITIVEPQAVAVLTRRVWAEPLRTARSAGMTSHAGTLARAHPRVPIGTSPG
jgi:hypothetical protein